MNEQTERDNWKTGFSVRTMKTPQVYALIQLQKHIGSCQYEPVYCESKCGMKIPRKLHADHDRRECTKRAVPCPYCLNEFVFDTLKVSSGVIHSDSLRAAQIELIYVNQKHDMEME